VDVLNDPDGRARLLALGMRDVPVLACGTRAILAQNMEAVAAFVGLDGTGHTRLTPETLLARWILVLEAAQRHVRQFPLERMPEQMTPTRDRTVRVMGYHVYRVVEVFLDVVDNGVLYSSADTEIPPAAERPDADGETIARYGATVIERLRGWWRDNERRSFEQPFPTTYGPASLHELFERSTWHSAQHTRQLAAVLERLGIAPDGPLTEADLRGLPMPETLWG